MTASTKAHLLLDSEPQIQGGAVLSPIEGGGTQRVPMILYGQGTPAGTIAPWKDLPKGSIWVSTNQSTYALYVKLADNSAVADWVIRKGATRVRYSDEINVDNGAGTKSYETLYWPVAVTVSAFDLVYTEATDASGAAEAAVRIGTAADGEQYVASVALAGSQALGTVVSLTPVTGTVAAASSMVISHTGIAATEVGAYRIRITYTTDMV